MSQMTTMSLGDNTNKLQRMDISIMQIETPQTLTRIQRRKALIRSQIIEAALQVFVENGYTKTTVQDITSRADIGHGTFYKYFKSKQNLLGILADDLVASVDDYIKPKDKQLSVRDRIYYGAVRILEFFVMHRTILLALREAVMVDKQLEDQWSKIHESLYKRVEFDIRGSMKRGYCRDIDADSVVLALTSMLEGFSHHIMMQPPSSVDIDLAARSLTELTYNGVFLNESDPHAAARHH